MKKVIFCLFLVSLLIFASCNRSRNREGEDLNDEEYRRGDKGLRLEFVEGAPPDRIYTGNEMDIIVEVRNMGAYPKTDSFDGRLEIYGFDEKAFSGERWDGSPFLSPELQGRSPRSPRGGRDVKRYQIDRVDTLFDSEFYEPTVIAAACYKYRTIADASICVDPEPYSIFDEDKVCNLREGGESYSLGTQGAPVAVTRIKEEIASQGIHFSIYIENVGKGKVIDERAINECPLELDYNDVDKILVRVSLPWDSAPDCQPKGDYRDPVRLDESGTGFIFCTFRKPDSKSAIETNLHIELDYRYLDWEEKKIRIINLDR
ncbi:hypothetical protein GF323_07045 [Candidatus Woesearchaeota archaeon]|nr:hypothetical protein [Candidatus Woesearchaeota archaeon]